MSDEDVKNRTKLKIMITSLMLGNPLRINKSEARVMVPISLEIVLVAALRTMLPPGNCGVLY